MRTKMNDGDNVKDDDDRVDIISRKAGEKHFRCEQCNYSSNRAGQWSSQESQADAHWRIIQEDSRGRCLPYLKQKIATL